MNRIETFADAIAAATAAADAIGQQLRGTGRRTFVATGGRTPGPAYDALSKMDLGWETITIAQTDERFVPRGAPDSNANLIEARLLTGLAADATFVPMKGDGASAEADALSAETALKPLLPARATLLGMGEDGHVASLFPENPDTPRWLNPKADRLVVGVEHSGEAPHVPRISLTLPALLQTGLIAILATGQEKRNVLEEALGAAGSKLPVGAILHQDRAPVRIFWAR
ncbi:MAG TPA: 6-phosphogluconolactonase [Caulobacteraceae bacterium]|jgi:6-phosphogluconolactonase|nr:6-phosphogluconolactonase [Caulobacteraceae bacterium]